MRGAQLPTGTMVEWLNAQPFLARLREDLQPGQLVHGESFNLFDAMCALGMVPAGLPVVSCHGSAATHLLLCSACVWWAPCSSRMQASHMPSDLARRCALEIGNPKTDAAAAVKERAGPSGAQTGPTLADLAPANLTYPQVLEVVDHLMAQASPAQAANLHIPAPALMTRALAWQHADELKPSIARAQPRAGPLSSTLAAAWPALGTALVPAARLLCSAFESSGFSTLAQKQGTATAGWQGRSQVAQHVGGWSWPHLHSGSKAGDAPPQA